MQNADNAHIPHLAGISSISHVAHKHQKMGLCNYCLALPIGLFDRSGGSVCKVSHQPSYQSLVESATEGYKLCELLVDAIHRYFLGDVSPLTKEPQTEAFSLRSDIAGQYIDGRKVPGNFGESEFQQESSFLTKSL
jgi:hypothetical protein